MASSHAAARRLVDRLKLFDAQVVSPTIAAMDTARRICGAGDSYSHRLPGLNRAFVNPGFNTMVGSKKRLTKIPWPFARSVLLYRVVRPTMIESKHTTGIILAYS